MTENNTMSQQSPQIHLKSFIQGFKIRTLYSFLIAGRNNEIGGSGQKGNY